MSGILALDREEKHIDYDFKYDITAVLPTEIKLVRSSDELDNIINFREQISPNLNYESQLFQNDGFDDNSYVLYSADEYGNIIATARLLLDSKYGLPEENDISKYINNLRGNNTKIAEAGRFVITKNKPKLLRLYYKMVYDIAKHQGIDIVVMMIKTKSIASYKRFMSINILAKDIALSWDAGRDDVSLIAWNINDYQPKFDRWTNRQKNIYSFKNWDNYSYSHLSIFTSIQKEIYEHIASKVSGSILDVGCGSGRIMAYMQNNKSAVNYTGIDLSLEMINQATWLKKELGFDEAKLVNANISSLSNTFDYIVSIHSYYAWDDKITMLKTIYNLLDNDGKFILVTPNNDFDKEKLSVVVKQEILGHPFYKDFMDINYEIAEIAEQKTLYRHIDSLIETVRGIGFKVNTAHNNFFLGGASYLELSK